MKSYKEVYEYKKQRLERIDREPSKLLCLFLYWSQYLGMDPFPLSGYNGNDEGETGDIDGR